MSIAGIPFKASTFDKGQRCIFRNRHSSGMMKFDGKTCVILDVLPQNFWLEDDIAEYRVKFLDYDGPLNNVRVEENELESLPN